MYPAAYDVQRPNPDETALVVGSLLNVEQPRATIAAQAAAGRSAAQVADELVAGFEPGLFDIARNTTTVPSSFRLLLPSVTSSDGGA